MNAIIPRTALSKLVSQMITEDKYNMSSHSIMSYIIDSGDAGMTTRENS